MNDLTEVNEPRSTGGCSKDSISVTDVYGAFAYLFSVWHQFCVVVS